MSIDELATKVLGMSKDEAFVMLAGDGCVVRIGSEDGSVSMLTDDWRVDRITLDLVDGKVVKASVG